MVVFHEKICKIFICLRQVVLCRLCFKTKHECSVSAVSQKYWRNWSPWILYLVTAVAKVTDSVAWRSLIGWSVSLTLPSVGSKCVLAFPNFVSTSCLSLYLDGERSVLSCSMFECLINKWLLLCPTGTIVLENSVQLSACAFLKRQIAEHTN